jgi:plastocyanin domain-containing protein
VIGPRSWLLAALPLALGLVAIAPGGEPPAAHAQHASPAPAVREIEIVVKGGYSPAQITITEGEQVRLRFVRQDEGSCTREVVFASLGIRRELPTGQPVIIDLPALAAGTYEFQCGMKMARGSIVVKPRT